MTGELRCGAGGNCRGLAEMLVVQNYAEEATIDRQPGFTVVIDKAKLPEFIHEMTDPRPGGADHLCQVFLIDPRNYSFGLAVLAKMRQQQENRSQALLARV